MIDGGLYDDITREAYGRLSVYEIGESPVSHYKDIEWKRQKKR
jgi:hypothetical protein